MKKYAVFLIVLLLVACVPSSQAIQTAIAQTQAAWTPTLTLPKNTIQVSVATATIPPAETATVDPKSFIQIVPGSVSCNFEDDNMVITGKIKNTSTGYDLQGVWMRGTAKKDDGTTVNTFSMQIDSDILFRNTTSTFTVEVTDPNGIGTKCDVTVDDAQVK